MKQKVAIEKHCKHLASSYVLFYLTLQLHLLSPIESWCNKNQVSSLFFTFLVYKSSNNNDFDQHKMKYVIKSLNDLNQTISLCCNVPLYCYNIYLIITRAIKSDNL